MKVKNFLKRIVHQQLALGTLLFAIPLTVNAQIAADYEVATWFHFKPAAVTFTFDDNTSKQLPVAVPLFDNYNFKVSLYPVTSWNPNWSSLKSVANKGHEIGSHTVSHNSLNTLGVEEQEDELSQSQTIIQNNVSGAKVLTIAYPNCNIGDVPTIEKYYIAGRTCSGQIVSKSPNDFYTISSIIVGKDGTVKTAEDFNSKVESAKSSNGWAVFLIHGIDGDGGYSDLSSAELGEHLEFLNENSADYWVETFGGVVKYIKERNAVSVTENTISDDSLKVIVTDGLDDAIYNGPLTIRRLIPTAWDDIRVFINGEEVSPLVVSDGGEKYVWLDIVPDKDEVFISNTNSAPIISGVKAIKENKSISIGANPFSREMVINTKDAIAYAVYTLEGELVESGKGIEEIRIGTALNPGTYILKVNQKEQTFSTKIIKAN